jgi:hypothetical protein
MKLSQKQQLFALMVAKLIQKADEMNFGVTLGEAWRSPETASQYEKAGKGLANSNHVIRLAVDLNLFRGNTFLTETHDYKPLGEWWEAQSNTTFKCCWGGRFEDGNHFSFEHGGVR